LKVSDCNPKTKKEDLIEFFLGISIEVSICTNNCCKNVEVVGEGIFVVKFNNKEGASLALKFDNLMLNGKSVQSKPFSYLKNMLVRKVVRVVIKPPDKVTALLIRNLSFKITESELEREFKRFNLIPNRTKI